MRAAAHTCRSTLRFVDSSRLDCTYALMHCKECGRTYEQKFEGKWSLSQLTAAMEVEDGKKTAK